MNKLKLLMALLLIAIIPFASAAGVTVVKKELIDSQYGIITDYLGVGTQIYRLTYSDGTTEEIAETGTLLNLGAITEQTLGSNIDSSVCYSANLPVRVKTIQDSANSFSDQHKVQVWLNDYTLSLDGLLKESAVYTNLKVYDSGAFSIPSGFSSPLTIVVPYNQYEQNIRYEFLVVEYQMKKDGTWVRLSNPGTGTTTTFSSYIKWWNTYQSGAGRGSLTGGSCRYTAPQPSAPVEPTPPPATTRTIQVTSSPTGATVTSSGQTLGTTPFSLTLDSGSAKILTFSLAGYPSVAKGVDINTASPMTAVFASAPLPTIPPTLPPTPPPVVTTAPPLGTPVVTTIPGQTTTAPASTSGSGGMTVETEQPTGGATVTYEQEPILNGTTILIVLVIGIIVVVAYSKLYVQKGKGKGKRRN